MKDAFEQAYTKLNPAQKKAVDTIDGPVMVVAGPGTGKTQILALRIANILKITDTEANGILCLTFTNSGVEAMRRRLRSYIGGDSGKIEINTYHSFGIKIIEEFFAVLSFLQAPRIAEGADLIAIFDQILNENSWNYLRPRGNSTFNFGNLKSLISLLKRENISPENFQIEIEREVERLKDDPSSISSRGESKGQLKKEIVGKIEGYERTLETVRFYEKYEGTKKEKNVMDYDDILTFMTEIVRESEEARAEIREKYLYILVDEHQDSSGTQNDFLKMIWADVEKPNIFVVGDDRQLIYGFGGASISHFEEFSKTFSGTKVITLTENYRSSQKILDTADSLLESSLASGKLKSQSEHNHPVFLMEAPYPRDEIFSAGEFFREKIESGISPNECALLVPKNSQIRSAITVLQDMGLPVSSAKSLKLFDSNDSDFFITILKIINNPYDSVAIAEALLDENSKIPTITAHRFIHSVNSRKLSLDSLMENTENENLLTNETISLFGKKLEKTINESAQKSVYSIVQNVGQDFFLDETNNPEIYLRQIEIVRSFLHLALSLEERNPKLKLEDYLAFIERLQEYGENIPLAIFGLNDGIQIMTLHGSKGLEFEAVWVAHLNERSLMGGRKNGFTLPESINERVHKKDEETAKRELYVAITRAKKFCTLSYAHLSHKGTEEKLAKIVESLPDETFEIIKVENTEVGIEHGLKTGKKNESKNKNGKSNLLKYIISNKKENPTITREVLQKMVAEKYHNTKVSVTLLNTFFDCPWKWYFKSFLQVPEKMSENLQFGSIVHGVIEKIVALDTTPKKNEILNFIEEEINKNHILDNDAIKRYEKDALIAVENFIERELKNLSEERESEKSLSCRDSDFPELLITGKIDLIENLSEEILRVTDFKTGKTRTKNDIEKTNEEGRMSDYLRQLSMYSYLISQNQKGKFEIESSRLYFVEEEKIEKAIYKTKINNEHIELLRQDIKDYDLALKTGDWTERVCNWKGYGGKETECPYCKKAEIFK